MTRRCAACGAPLVRKRYADGKPESPKRFAERQHCDRSCRARRRPGWRFEDCYVVSDDGCWLWRGPVQTTGYARIYIPETRTQVHAHRYAWQRANGPVPEGMQLDHLCRIRHCVNPQHMEAVTQAENVRRGAGTKLTAEGAERIRSRRAAGESLKIIARDFGINEAHASRVARGLVWA